MNITTKGRYALRIMLDIAQQHTEHYTSIKEIARRQGISVKYLEAIASTLNKAGLLESSRGKNGGYRLSRDPEDYSVGSILKETEANLSSVPCLKGQTVSCSKADQCETLPLWQLLDGRVDEILESVTLADLLAGRLPPVVLEKKVFY
ncbi:MAG: Rrf2 family transcriptional regulator [Bacillota bacterium]|nr:Rrf2 family transcriptional regulator [Eubacteriales bacterium]MDI9492165.1 Rrf2 family transcriptional regulator [Bacillota bacterium]NLV70510.1 Rrf2 family transcriptional regulator [Clostridiales bacterium]HRV33935.1 Rrf2 family transcriptional regulator [Anaerovoracaceae bacterium]MDD3537697.1 Rrf2 family transcriptional regulator [Eubacteriales bacterium]